MWERDAAAAIHELFGERIIGAMLIGVRTESSL
jgi:hypothetical protein